MKTIEKDNGWFELIPETETLRSIAVAIIMASYEQASPFGMGFMRANATNLTKVMAEKMLDGEDISHDYCINHNKPNKVNMDYVFGRCCKTYITIKPEKNLVSVGISERDRNPKAILKLAQELLTNTKE